MSNSIIVPETDIFIATVGFLLQRGVIPYHFSIPKGKGIDTKSLKKKLEDGSKALGINPSFIRDGADMIALSEKEWWHIECKGSGGGKPQTQTAKFHIVLSSVVSHYGEDKSILPERCRSADQYLGLSIPETKQYLNELNRRVKRPLRQRLNLWVLLYDISTRTIRAIEPNQEYK